MDAVLDKAICEQAVVRNAAKTRLTQLLEINLDKIFSKVQDDYKYIAITKTFPKEVFAFRNKGMLLKFLAKNPVAAWRYRGYKESIFLL